MKKDLIIPPMLPYTPEEEAALVEKLEALTAPGLLQYMESAQSTLANNTLAPTWRPRVELGLKIAKEALVKANAAAALPSPLAG